MLVGFASCLLGDYVAEVDADHDYNGREDNSTNDADFGFEAGHVFTCETDKDSLFFLFCFDFGDISIYMV